MRINVKEAKYAVKGYNSAMINSSAPTSAYDTLWPLVRPPGACDRIIEDAAFLNPAAARLVNLIGAPMAAYLLGSGLTESLGIPELSPERLKRDRLRNSFLRNNGLKWAGFIAETGIDVMYLKGFATTHDIYPDPDLRSMTDIDILLRRADLNRFISAFREKGFDFRKTPETPLWGFISNASFLPFCSSDGVTNIDIHIAPDDYPVHRSLDTETLFAASRMIEVNGQTIRLPSRDHLFALAITNAIRDKFEADSLKGMIDALTFLFLDDWQVDWALIEDLARRGGFAKGLSCFLKLIQHVNPPPAPLPGQIIKPYHGATAIEFDHLLGEMLTLFPEEPTMFTRLKRETLLTAEPRTIVWKNLRRLKGLVSPSQGLPSESS